jgi:hypothetical protein
MIRAELDAGFFWKRFHSDMEKYIPELGARQIVSCAGVEICQINALIVGWQFRQRTAEPAY